VVQVDIVNPFLILLQEDFLFLLKLIQLPLVVEVPQVLMARLMEDPVLIQFFLQSHLPAVEEAQALVKLA
jgi:hypothetical protein